MRITRVYQNSVLQEQEMILLSKEASHHLIHVLRFSIGDSFVLFNGQGGEYCAKITAIEKHRLLAETKTFYPVERESSVHIELAQGIARGNHMDFVIQKAVELGVNVITPLLTKRCNTKLSKEREEKRLNHWNKIIISACEQCGRNTLPLLNSVLSLSDWLPSIQAKIKLILHPKGNEKISQINCSDKKVTLLIGPEGGFDEKELLLAQHYHFLPIQLGSRILRTETAPLAAISIIQAKYEEM